MNLWTNDTSSHDDFGRCAGRDRENAERALRACGRLIGERQSTAVTAAAYYFRGLLYHSLRQPDRARADWEQSLINFTTTLRNDRRNPDVYSNRANVLARLRRYDEALADFEQALSVLDAANDASGTRTRSNIADRRAGQVAGLHASVGGIQFRRGDLNAAAAAYDRAAAFDPEDATYQGGRCEMRAAAGVELEVAASACEAALTLSERDGDSLFSRGFLRYSQGDLAGALADFSAAIAADDECHIALYGRGVVTAQLGQREAGEADIARAADDLVPDLVEAYAAAGLRI